MAKFAAVHQTAAGTTLVIMNLTGSAAVRLNIFYLCLGHDGTPADLAGEFTANRTTTAGAGGTAITGEPLDPLTSAAVGAGTGGVYTAAPTVTAATELLMIGLNQRATIQWYAAQPGCELISTATANNGICFRSVAHGGTPNVNICAHWFE